MVDKAICLVSGSDDIVPLYVYSSIFGVVSFLSPFCPIQLFVCMSVIGSPPASTSTSASHPPFHLDMKCMHVRPRYPRYGVRASI